MSRARKERRGTRQLIESFDMPQVPYRDTDGRGTFWQTARLNMQMLEVYRDEIMTLALNRYRWVNLPKTVDPLMLEWLLMVNGQASIAFPKDRPGLFVATSFAANTPLNIYRRPKKWTCVPYNGQDRSFEASFASGTVVYDSQTRYPVLNKIDAYAQQLADIYITRRVNLYHQRIPAILAVPQDKELDAVNIAKQIGGGEPMILGYDAVSEVEYKALTQKPAPYIGGDLTDAERAVWARVFDMLGIPNVIFKSERQITTEVEAQQEETSIIRLSGLRERRLAADELNRRFYEPNPFYPKLLDAPVSVVKAEDYESNVWNVLHSLDFEPGDNGVNVEGVRGE